MFLESEQFNISKIYFTSYYAPKGKKRYIYPGCLPSYELMYYKEGKTVIYYDGEVIKMKEGDVLYLPKGIIGAKYTLDVKEDFALYNVYFDTNEPMPEKPIHFSTKSKEIGLTYDKLYTSWMEKKDTYYYKSVREFFKILELIKKEHGYNTLERFKKIAIAEEYISLHYCDADFDFKELHKLTGLSYTYFKKLFIDKNGVPPSKYVTFLRINRACELLISNLLKVDEIASMCGFNDVYYFSKLFKKIKGVSPTGFKKQNNAFNYKK